MTGNGVFRWWTGSSEDAEYWGGSYATREAAIAQGTLDYEGEPFFVFEADKSVVTAIFNSSSAAETIIESLEEHNEECWGEDGPDTPWERDAISDLENAIERTVSEWLKRHPGDTWSAGEVRVSEQIIPATPVAASP